MVSADLDVPSSGAVCSVFERLPATAVVPTPWHVCGTPPLVSLASTWFRSRHT